MFAPLFILALAILSIIGASSLSVLDQERASVNLASSMSSFYVTESTLEESLLDIRRQKEDPAYYGNTLIRSQEKQAEDLTKKTGSVDVDGLPVDIVERTFVANPKRLTSQVAKNSGEFRFIDVADQNSFVELNFFLKNAADEASSSGDLSKNFLLDLVVFPRNRFTGGVGSTELDFGSVRTLASKSGDPCRTIVRLMYNSSLADLAQDRPTGTPNCPVNLGSGISIVGSTNTETTSATLRYGQVFQIKGLNPVTENYILRWQTLDGAKVDYALVAYKDDATLAELPNQLIEVDSLTATQNMYQRVKNQEASFAPLQPGLAFALFSDNPISK